MAENEVIRRDVTNEPESLARAIHAPELRDALLECGFGSVSIVEFRAPGFTTQEQLEEMFERSEAAKILEFAENGEIDEILHNPDKTAFAVIERHFGGPVVTFLSITTDSTIVETAMMPVRAPKASPNIIGVPQTTLSNLLSQIQARLNRVALGMPSIWSRDNRPQSGYHLMFVETKQVDDLWLHHQQHLGKTLRKEQLIPEHDTVSLYLCLKARTDQIREYVGKWSRILKGVNTILSIIVIVLLGLGVVVIPYLSMRPAITVIVLLAAIWLFVPISFLFPYLITGFTRVAILPHLRGPGLMTVSEIMREMTQ